MDAKYERGILRISAVFIIAAALIIPLGFLDIGPSPMILLAMVFLGIVTFLTWQSIDAYSQYLSGLWLGPVIAGIVSLIAIVEGASPGEFQALGGIAGLIGVINLLLRPVYRIVHYILSVTIQIGREIQEEGW